MNGQEKDDEVTGNPGSHTSALFWEYDTRLGRRWNLDPEPMAGVSDYSTFNNNPILQVDILGNKPTPKQAAAIASHVYGDKSDKILRGGWKVSNRDFGIEKNGENGLKSQVYERTKKGKTEYVYATAGTEADMGDIKADAIQPFSSSSQYDQSVGNAKSLSNQLSYEGAELTFTGHSLGGGEAAANAYATGRDAITFNAAGVTKSNLDRYGIVGQSKVDAYIMLTDPLNLMQNKNPMLPSVNGTRHYILPWTKSAIFNGHSMNNMLDAFGVPNIPKETPVQAAPGPIAVPTYRY